MLKQYLEKYRLEAGCDEAGRGCLAGPVFAAAVLLDPDRPISGLNDSKKLTEKQRNNLRDCIENQALDWSVASCNVDEIDCINILKASILAMQKAVSTLKRKPDFLLIDGNRFSPFEDYQYTTVVRGDSIYASIAAASILAKTHRDDYMKQLAVSYPDYGLERHKGYATTQHINAIKKFGYANIHRRSFILKQLQTTLF